MHPNCRITDIPLKIASVLSTIRERFAQLDTSEDAGLVADAADVLYHAVHATGHVNGVANVDAAAIGAHPAVRSGWVPYERVEGGFPCDSLSGAGG